MDVQGARQTSLSGLKRRRAAEPPAFLTTTLCAKTMEVQGEGPNSPDLGGATATQPNIQQMPTGPVLIPDPSIALPPTPQRLATVPEGSRTSSIGQPPVPILPQPASMASFVQSSLHWVYSMSTPETFDSHGQPKNRRKRRRTTDEEQAALEAAYRLDPQMPPAEREKLANTLNMPPKSVQIWFQNRRQTAKKMRDGTWNGVGKWQRTPYKVVGNFKVVGPEHVSTPSPSKSNDPIDHAGVVDAVHALIGLSQGNSQDEPTPSPDPPERSPSSTTQMEPQMDNQPAAKVTDNEPKKSTGAIESFQFLPTVTLPIPSDPDPKTTSGWTQNPVQPAATEQVAAAETIEAIADLLQPIIPDVAASIDKEATIPPLDTILADSETVDGDSDTETVAIEPDEVADIPARLMASTSHLSHISSQASEFFDFNSYAAAAQDVEKEILT